MADNDSRPVPTSFELDDLMAELNAAYNNDRVAQRPPNTYRTEEIKELLGLGTQAARRRIREWHKAGLIKPVKAPHENMWGTVQTVPMVQFIVESE